MPNSYSSVYAIKSGVDGKVFVVESSVFFDEETYVHTYGDGEYQSKKQHYHEDIRTSFNVEVDELNNLWLRSPVLLTKGRNL
ncbi:MAG: hypothetical protein ACJAZY_003818 [Spirosomataceae bacterium]